MKKNIAIRIEEFSAWLPMTTDVVAPVNIANGIVSFEALDNEKLIDVDVTSTGQHKFFPIEIDGETINQKHALYVYRVTLAGFSEVPVPRQPDSAADKPDHAVALPGHQNREQRRKSQGKKDR